MSDEIDREISERIGAMDAELRVIEAQEVGSRDLDRLFKVARALNELCEDAEAVGGDIRPRLTAEDRREEFKLQARLARLMEKTQRPEGEG